MKGIDLANHPNFAGRKADLEPNQPGLLKITKKHEEKKKAGNAFEKNMSLQIRNAFTDAILLDDVYFETGVYNTKLCMYESMQIDHIFITSKGVWVLEDKYIDDGKYLSVSSGALSKTWLLKKRVGSISETNGLKQNYRHMQFVKEIFNYIGLDIPVFQMTIIGGIGRDKIRVQQFIDANLVTEDEAVDRMEYLLKRQVDMGISTQKVLKELSKWICTVPNIEKSHIAFVRNKEKNRLPARCKKVMRKL